MEFTWRARYWKPHVLKIIKQELFEKVLKWELGTEFQVVAFQAVMAGLLDGDTIHHALGLSVYKRNGENHREDGTKGKTLRRNCCDGDGC